MAHCANIVYNLSCTTFIKTRKVVSGNYYTAKTN